MVSGIKLRLDLLPMLLYRKTISNQDFNGNTLVSNFLPSNFLNSRFSEGKQVFSVSHAVCAVEGS